MAVIRGALLHFWSAHKGSPFTEEAGWVQVVEVEVEQEEEAVLLQP